MHLSGKLDFENFTQQNQMDIAKELGYAKKRITHYTLTNFQADRTWKHKGRTVEVKTLLAHRWE